MTSSVPTSEQLHASRNAAGAIDGRLAGSLRPSPRVYHMGRHLEGLPSCSSCTHRIRLPMPVMSGWQWAQDGGIQGSGSQASQEDE